MNWQERGRKQACSSLKRWTLMKMTVFCDTASWSLETEGFTAAIIIAPSMVAVRFSETSDYSNETTLPYVPEGCHLHTCRQNLESHYSLYLMPRRNWITPAKTEVMKMSPESRRTLDLINRSRRVKHDTNIQTSKVLFPVFVNVTNGLRQHNAICLLRSQRQMAFSVEIILHNSALFSPC
jgi:hypothetical protein